MARIVTHPAFDRQRRVALADQLGHYRHARRRAIDGLERARLHLAELCRLAPAIAIDALTIELHDIHEAVRALDPERPPPLQAARHLLARAEALGTAIAERLTHLRQTS